MNSKPPVWDRVFHPTDFSSGNDGALIHAIKLAVLQKTELVLMHTEPQDAEISWSKFPRIRKTLETWGAIPPGLSHKGVRDALGLNIKKLCKKDANVVDSILKEAADSEPDLIVVSTHQRRGIQRLLKGSLAEPIASGANLTLVIPRGVKGFVARETGEVHLANILVPIDYSPHPQIAVDAAVKFALAARVTNTRITLLHIGPDGTLPEVDLPTLPGFHFETASWEGNVVEHILSAAQERDADLIVMATNGHDGLFDAFLGTTTEKILRSAKRPVLVVRA